MQRFDLLTKLPSRLSCIIMQDWLSLKSVIALDSAYCCHSHRVLFSDLVRSDEYFVREALTITFKSAILNGLHRYGEKLRNVVFAGELTPQQEKLVVTHCCNCTHVRFLSDRAYYGALQNISSNKVVWLDLSGTFLSPLRIAGFCPRLKTLGLKRTDLTDNNLNDITRKCQIVHLDIGNNDRLTDTGILKVVTNLKSLRGLNIEGCANLTDASLVHIYTHCAGTLHTLQLNCRKIEDVNIASFSAPAFSIPTICVLLQHCTQLRTLHLGKNVPFREGIINIPASSLCNLTTLVLGRSVCIDNIDDSHIIRYKLQTLAIDFIYHNAPLRGFVACRTCPYLSEVNLVMGFWEDEDMYTTDIAEVAPKLTDALKAIRPELIVHFMHSWSRYSQHDVMNM